MPGNDMWAFGNILFESALGYPSIEGETYNDILSGIFGRYGNPTRSDLRYIDVCIENDRYFIFYTLFFFTLFF